MRAYHWGLARVIAIRPVAPHSEAEKWQKRALDQFIYSMFNRARMCITWHTFGAERARIYLWVCLTQREYAHLWTRRLEVTT
jgi:hypothetical protein